MIGRTISHYQVVEKLGEGGMGVVYKAHDSHLDRSVAIKVLPPEKVADPERKRRFVQEARAASALRHPNIVTIYDIDRHDGVDYIAMEYIPGRTVVPGNPDLVDTLGLEPHPFPHPSFYFNFNGHSGSSAGLLSRSGRSSN
jgi:serine/threonine protein kinase